MAAVDVIRRRVKTYSLNRRGPAVRIDGIAQPGTPVITDVLAYHQPMSPKELRNLPPGQNAGEWRNVWTEYPIKLTDIITLSGIAFTIQKVELWEDGPFHIGRANYTEDELS